jgi:outer membrane protein TolC
MSAHWFALGTASLVLSMACVVRAGSDGNLTPKGPRLRAPQPITLDAAMRLAGARNLEIQIARQRLMESEANELLAIERFFPALTPGVQFRRHENNIQTVEVHIINADKEQFTAGVTVGAEIDIGEAIYRTLAARQLVRAAAHSVGAHEQESIYRAAIAFFDLAKAHAASGIAADSVRIAQDYLAQVRQAVEAGLAFKGDVFRATTQMERNRLIQVQTREEQRLAASRLAEVLDLDPRIELLPGDGALLPLQFVTAQRDTGSLVAQAMSARPELREAGSAVEAARRARSGAIVGPLIPTIGAQAFYGRLGGGVGSPGPNDSGQSSDYAAGVSWRIGPGGLFDAGRIRANNARLKTSELELEKLRAEVTRQVVDSHVRIRSLADQLESARRGLAAARQTFTLARDRREFGVGVVLETIQAEQELTRARLDYVALVAQHNKAQFELERACGALRAGVASSGRHPSDK